MIRLDDRATDEHAEHCRIGFVQVCAENAPAWRQTSIRLWYRFVTGFSLRQAIGSAVSVC
jgi:hypothetical protein